jgi:hypothetical protein
MKREWQATTAALYVSENIDIPTIPDPPEGQGWRLVTAIKDNNTYAYGEIDGGVIWYWERERTEEGTYR